MTYFVVCDNIKKNRRGGISMFSSSKAYSTASLNSAIGSSVWLIVSLVLAIVGGILVYFLFLSKKMKENSLAFLDGYMIFYHLKKCF